MGLVELLQAVVVGGAGLHTGLFVVGDGEGEERGVAACRALA